MEHYFRTALWILVLIGCLQAVPVPEMSDFHFKSLQGVPCHGNDTFKSPKSASDSCLDAAVDTIKKEVKRASNVCQCQRCPKVLEALDRVKVPSTVIQRNSTECRGELEGSLTFHAFAKEFQHVIQRINNLPEQ